jgi:photosynthetic reaction center H subunit
MKGTILGNFDVAQVTLYLFWIFFAGLIYYLLRENKREGYPLESDRSGRVKVQGFPAIPPPKTYRLPHGGTQVSPRVESDTRELKAKPTGPWPGAPLSPTGNPMRDGVGPAAWTERADTPDLTVSGQPRIVPMRLDADYHLDTRDPDPRGMTVIGADRQIGGTVKDVWVDRSESLIRYLEVEVAGGRNVLLPMNFCRVNGHRRMVKVKSIKGSHFADVPQHAMPDRVTRREEDRICAYYGSGHLYADPMRSEPLI